MKNFDPDLVVMTRKAFDELFANATNNPFKKSSEALKGIHKHVRKKNPLLGAEWRENLRLEQGRISFEKKEAARVAGKFAGKMVYCTVNDHYSIPVRVLGPCKKVKGLIRVIHLLNIPMTVHHSQLTEELPDGRQTIENPAIKIGAEILGHRRLSYGSGARVGDHDGDRPISHGPRY